MKRILSIALTLSIFLTFIPSVSANEEEADYAAGLIWDSPETIEEHLREEEPPAWEETLPASVDLTDTFPTPGNQGRQNSCVAWAAAYALRSHQEQTRQSWGLDTDEHLFSPSYVYNQCNHGIDGGMSIVTALELIVKQGVCTLSSFPYKASDYLTQPTTEQKAEAACYRTKDWYTIQGNDSIKNRLAKGDGVIIGVNLFPDFDKISADNPVFDVLYGQSRGSHAVCLIGYDDNMACYGGTKGAFKFINSWGTSWGIDGYGWISYDLMGYIMVNAHGSEIGFAMGARENEYSEGLFDYTVSDGEAAIVRYFGDGGAVAIPDTLGGYPVTKICDNAFIGNKLITSVFIPDSITAIGSDAFSACTALTDISIPDSVVTIGEEAFSYCNSLSSAYIGSGVASIGKRAFSNCIELNGVTVSAYNAYYEDIDGVLFAKNPKILIYYPLARTGTYTIPDGTIEIGDWAFCGCEDLTGVDIPGSVTTIGEFAFGGCDGLTEIIFPEGVTTINDNAFCAIMSPIKIFIPDSVTYIGDYAFFPGMYYGLMIYCNKDSYIYKYAMDWGLPFTTKLAVSPITNAEEPVNHITMTYDIDGYYNLTADCENTEDLLFFFASYDGDLMTNAYIADENGEIRNILGEDMKNGRIFIWDKSMRPCIETIKP